MIRSALPSDTAALVALGESTGIFGPGEADALLRGTLDALHAGRLGAGDQVRVWVDSHGLPGGWVYFAPRESQDNAWDLWWIGVAAVRHGQGIGDALLRFVEAHVTSAGGRIVFIETSSLAPLARARGFYVDHGYRIDGVVTNYYGDGDDKVTFVKTLDDADRRARTAGEPVRIEKATLLDIEAVSTLLAGQLAEHAIALEAERVRGGVVGMLEVPSRGSILVARTGGAIIGIALLAMTWTVEHGGLVAWLDELYVVPGRRGGGVGQALLAAALSEARSLGCLAVELEVDVGHARAEHLYARNGFLRVPRARWVCALAKPAASAKIGFIAPRDSALDHVSLGVNDLARSRAFYDAALAPLGWVAHPQSDHEVGYGPPLHEEAGALPLYIGFEECSERRQVEPSAGFHIAIRAPSRLAVQAFHRAALAAGGTDRGEPGVRAHYHSEYYGSFVVDPDGHHIEAVFHR